MALTKKWDKSIWSLIFEGPKNVKEREEEEKKKKRKRKRRRREEKEFKKDAKVWNYEFLYEFPYNCMVSSLPQT